MVSHRIGARQRRATTSTDGPTRFEAGPDAWREGCVDASTWARLRALVASGELHCDGFSTITTMAERERRRWPPTTPERLAAALAMMGDEPGEGAPAARRGR